MDWIPSIAVVLIDIIRLIIVGISIKRIKKNPNFFGAIIMTDIINLDISQKTLKIKISLF